MHTTHKERFSLILAFALVVALTIVPLAGGARMVEDLMLVTTGPNGTGGNNDSERPMLSADGSTIVFSSYASDLIDGFTPNGHSQIYSYDIATETFTLITKGDGSGGNADSAMPVVSVDGTKIAFYSVASNLIPGAPAIGSENIYLYDALTDTVRMVSKPTVEVSGDARYLSMSADGSTVAYQAKFLDGEYFDRIQVIRYDVATDTSQVISRNSLGVLGDNESGTSDVSADGSRIVFLSKAHNLVEGITTGDQYYLWDETAGLSCISTTPTGAASDNSLTWRQPSISSDGTRIAFVANATNLVSPAANGNDNAFLWNESAGITLITIGSSGVGGNGGTKGVALSPDGTLAGVVSYATDLVGGMTTNTQDNVFLYTLADNSVELITQGADGIGGNNESNRPCVLSMGPNRMMTFHSEASDLIDGLDVNGGLNGEGSIRQVYLWGRVQLLTVTYDAQNSTTPATTEVFWGDTAPVPTQPTKKGFEFAGWWTAPDGGTLWDFTDPVTADMTLYAHWTPVKDGLPPTGDALSLMAPALLALGALVVNEGRKRR